MAYQYTVTANDTAGLNSIANRFGFSDYKAAGVGSVPSGNFDLIRPGDVINFGNYNGPQTTPENQAVVGSGPANMEFSGYSNDLSKALAALNQTPNPQTSPSVNINNVSANDPYAQMLDKLSATSNASTKALIASIQAERERQGNSIDVQYDNYKRGLQLLGIQHNEAQSTPDLLMGHIQQAETEHQQKIQALDVEEKKALMDAETAQAKGDLDILKEKMDRVKAIQEEKQQALKDIYDTMNTQTSIAENQAHQIYDVFSKLDPADQEIFIQEVAKKYNLPLAALTVALADEKAKRAKDDLAMQQAEANLAKTQSGGSQTQAEIAQANYANMASALDSKVGSDGYLSPDDYKTAKKAWIGYGLNPKDFDEHFAYSYVNPSHAEDYGVDPSIKFGNF